MDTKEKDFKNELVNVCLKQLVESTEFKKPWLEQVSKYEDAYYGKEKETFRVQFNVPLPVLPGMVDALKDAFDDELAMRIGHKHPADAQKVQKFQSLFDDEVRSLRPNAMWDYKTRADKFLAILSGRGIQKTFAESDPKFQLNFEVVDYRYFHCEPKGGGLLDRHMFMGEEGIFKTKKQLEDGAQSGLYDKNAVTQMVSAGKSSEYKAEVENVYGTKLSRFEALGLDPENHNYVGEEQFNLCEWYPTYKGKQWYVLFDPWTRQIVRMDPLKAVFESGLRPYTSWATHEDPKVFWTISYSKYFYIAHESIRELVSQEFTNRQKKNMTPKYFDAEMFDAARIDKAQYEPDALIPVKTFNGTRKIQEGIYQFEVKELGSATIDIAKWLSDEFKNLTGTQDITDEARAKVPANVVYSKLQSAHKRLSHRAKSFREAYAASTLRAFHGCNEHLSEPQAIRMMGPKGYAWDYISREDFKLEKEIDPTVVSKSEEDELNVMGKNQKKQAIDTVLAHPELLQVSNPKKIAETIYRDLGGWKGDEVDELMDTNAFQSMAMKDKADIAILQLCKGKMPDIVYDADLGFAERIMQFEKDHRNQLAVKLQTNDKGEIKIFYTYLQQHMPLIASNMGKLANQLQSQKKIANSQNQNQNGQPTASRPGPTSSPAQATLTPQVQQPDMTMAGGTGGQNGA